MNIETVVMNEDGSRSPMIDDLGPVRRRERRTVVIRVSEEFVFTFAAMALRAPFGMLRLPDLPELPDGCEVNHVSHDPLSKCFLFFIEHPSFDPVQDGMPAPEYPKLPRQSFRTVKIDTGDDNVVKFDASKMSRHERDQLEDAIMRITTST